jgi:hypothetical protein
METREVIARQYHSTLEMLESAIRTCPKAIWLDSSGDSPNRYWHIAYHALFYTHFYLAPTEADFVPWPMHRAGYNFLGAVPGAPNERPKVDKPYQPPELLDYALFCQSEVSRQMASVDFDAPSGFYWLPFSKFELQLYTLRHLAHHTGQLADRLRSQANLGVGWVR